MLPPGALDGVRVLDLSRVLAGPWCTQVLADLGAEVIKVEKPGEGDDTRKWGPPFLKDADGNDTTESAYYLSANRNKRSVAVDIARPEGQAVVRRLLGSCQVLVENFKVGGLARYGLSWGDLRADFPALVYCSITGFGQSGPYAGRAGYDYLAQGMGGMMSLTGAPDGEPMKIPVANADLVAGMYAAVAILAVLRHAERTGRGQQIDVALLDCQVAWMSYAAENCLVSGRAPARLGNQHPSIVPYQVFAAADGHLILAVGNDGQFARFCAFAGRPDWVADPRFSTNAARVRHREALVPLLAELIAQHPRAYWLDGLEAAGVPAAGRHPARGAGRRPGARPRPGRRGCPSAGAAAGAAADQPVEAGGDAPRPAPGAAAAGPAYRRGAARDRIVGRRGGGAEGRRRGVNQERRRPAKGGARRPPRPAPSGGKRRGKVGGC
jgi:crotonobetainyl-CoA:carnitine CoA-transferase CaiB-like acyl-CoA transferase